MKKMITTVALLAALIVVLGAQSGICSSHDSQPDAAMLMEKLEVVLKNQAEIIAQLKEVKEELEVVKVRATRR